MTTSSWRLACRISEILKCLECAYSAWKFSDYNKLREKARRDILCYDWDIVWNKFWKPIFELLEKKLEVTNCDLKDKGVK